MKERISMKDPEPHDPHPFVERPNSKPDLLSNKTIDKHDPFSIKHTEPMFVESRWNPPPTVLDPLSQRSSQMLEDLSVGMSKTPHDGHTPKDNLTDKDTNPKDAIATNKVPLSLVPEILAIYASMGFLEGALKYGKYNWRIAGVRSSIYIDALKRHIASYESGEDISENGVHHLSNALACIGILLDARACGKLNDDRPPRALMIPKIMKQMEEDVARLREKFKEHHPHQYTIADSVDRQVLEEETHG